jgi:hypothetical protein
MNNMHFDAGYPIGAYDINKKDGVFIFNVDTGAESFGVVTAVNKKTVTITVKGRSKIYTLKLRPDDVVPSDGESTPTEYLYAETTMKLPRYNFEPTLDD